MKNQNNWSNPRVLSADTEYVVTVSNADELPTSIEYEEYDAAYVHYSHLIMMAAQKCTTCGEPENTNHPRFNIGIFHVKSGTYLKGCTIQVYECGEIIKERTKVEDESFLKEQQ